MNRNDAMRMGGKVNREAIELGFSLAKPGMTKLALGERIGQFIRDHGMTPAFRGYMGFPGDVCICIDEEIVHGIPNERTIKDGSILTIDCGVTYNNYHVDAAHTEIIGNPRSSNDVKLVYVGEQLFKSYMKLLRAGLTLYDVAKIGDDLFRPAGFNIYPNLCGHYIGHKIHMDPSIFHTTHIGQEGIIRELKRFELSVGDTLCVEPVITLGIPSDKIAGDGWTVLTRDGSYTAHFEHTLLILEDEAEILS